MNLNQDFMPLHIKERLLRLARHLPKDGRGPFVRNVTSRLAEIVQDHPRTMVYAAIGWAVGSLLDDVLAFGVPLTDTVIQLTGDKASALGTAAGALLGFVDDRQDLQLRRRMVKVVHEEFSRASELQG